MITKENTAGNLTIDGIHAGSGVSAGTTKTLNLIPTFYIGGIDPSIAESAKTNLKGLNQSFEGCIRKIQLNGKPVDTFTRIGVVPCAQNVEPGVFFASGGGFVRASKYGFKLKFYKFSFLIMIQSFSFFFSF